MQSANPVCITMLMIELPSLLLFYKGKEIERRAGAMPAQMFDQWLENQVSQLGV